MQTGTTLFVSHDTAAVRGLCNKAIWLEKGRVFQIGQPKDICENYLEAFYEAQQGKSLARRKRCSAEPQIQTVKDQRREFINSSNLRNDIRVFSFDPNGESFGRGGALISSVSFHDVHGAPLAWIVGGEDVVLQIRAEVREKLHAPLVGFFVKDKLGQCLFGDNTYLRYIDTPATCEPGRELIAEFSFQMPRLAAGDYAVTVAVADGSQQEHIQHHWIHDAIMFRSESTSVSSGIVGIPMIRINLSII
jgi:lipopolysaccharide transport system ATP-binding protein